VATRREYPTDPNDWSIGPNATSLPLATTRPLTEIEALMELAPHEESSVPSLLETIALKEAVGEAIDALEPEDRWIINALFVEHLSLRAAGKILGIPKTSLARRRDYIRRQLMANLSESPAAVQWLKEGLGLRALHALPEQPHE